jgi:hypothetical protein
VYLDEWKAISARINGLLRSGELLAQFLHSREDPYRAEIALRDQMEKVKNTLVLFAEAHRASLTPDITDCIERFGTSVGPYLGTNATNEMIRSCLIRFGAFESEVSFLLKDTQAQIRARSERAFLHLQRSLVVDEALRSRWQTAFETGELACEKLGAVHLLLHGIWAFKVDASGERTDLVFDEPLDFGDVEQRAVEGAVLTEWKVAKPGKVTEIYEKARDQAKAYALGALAGNVLKNYRYLVVVSETNLEIPGDFLLGESIFRNINIVLNPDSPSKRKRLSEIT